MSWKAFQLVVRVPSMNYVKPTEKMPEIEIDYTFDLVSRLCLVSPAPVCVTKLLSMLGAHEWRPRHAGQRGLRILSLDGGGTRGVMTIAILREVLKGIDKDVHEVRSVARIARLWGVGSRHTRCYGGHPLCALSTRA